MEILIGLILFLLVGGYTSFNKIEKEEKIVYKKTVEDTSFNTMRTRKS